MKLLTDSMTEVLCALFNQLCQINASGRLYDKLGNIRQWWDNATIEKFEKKAQCIEDQYANYVLDQVQMRINGKNTKGENIADNGGLKQVSGAVLSCLIILYCIGLAMINLITVFVMWVTSPRSLKSLSLLPIRNAGDGSLGLLCYLINIK
jgi:hypothetical protein